MYSLRLTKTERLLFSLMETIFTNTMSKKINQKSFLLLLFFVGWGAVQGSDHQTSGLPPSPIEIQRNILELAKNHGALLLLEDFIRALKECKLDEALDQYKKNSAMLAPIKTTI